MYCNALRDRLQVKNAVKSVKIKNILECSEKLQRVFIFFRNSEIVQNNYGIRNNSVLKYCQKVIWEIVHKCKWWFTWLSAVKIS